MSNYPRLQPPYQPALKPIGIRIFFVFLGLLTLVAAFVSFVFAGLSQFGDCMPPSRIEGDVCGHEKGLMLVGFLGLALILGVLGLFTIITGSRRTFVFKSGEEFWLGS